MSDEIYQAPTANLSDYNHADQLNSGGSVETALRGEYVIAIGDMRREAWRLVKGNKGIICLAVIFLAFCSIGATKVLEILGVPNGQAEITSGEWFRGYGLSIMSGWIIAPFTAPLAAGLYLLSIKRAATIPVSFNELFAYFPNVLNLIILSVLSTVLIYIGFALLILPGIYLTVAYAFAVPLMLDKKLSPWQSLETSRRAVTHHWFPIFGFGILLYLILILSAFTLVGLIWTVPMCLLAYGLLYRTIFGVDTVGQA